MMKYLCLFLCLLALGCTTTKTPKKTPKEKVELFKEAEDYYEKGLLVQAEAKYREVLTLAPNMYDAWLKLGNIFARTGQLDAAIIAYERCVKIAPDEIKGWNNLALTRVMQATEVAREGVTVTPLDSVGRGQLEELFEQLILINQN